MRARGRGRQDEGGRFRHPTRWVGIRYPASLEQYPVGSHRLPRRLWSDTRWVGSAYPPSLERYHRLWNDTHWVDEGYPASLEQYPVGSHRLPTVFGTIPSG